MAGRWYAGNVQECGRQVNVQYNFVHPRGAGVNNGYIGRYRYLYSRGTRMDAGPLDQKRHPHIEFEREALALYQAKLAQVVAMIGRINDVRVVQFAQRHQLLVHPFDGHINTL